MFLELGIFLSQAIWLWRVRHICREAKKCGLSYDEYIAINPSKKPDRCQSPNSVEDLEDGLPPNTPVMDAEKKLPLPVEKCWIRRP
jgi:hypothetical protein